MVEFDCQTCGACCIEAGKVPIFFDDNVPSEHVENIPPRDTFTRSGEGFLLRTYDRILTRHLGGRCKALEGEIGKSCSCGIYENRPSVCKTYESGSGACQSSRLIAEYRMEKMDQGPRGYGPNWQETV